MPPKCPLCGAHHTSTVPCPKFTTGGNERIRIPSDGPMQHDLTTDMDAWEGTYEKVSPPFAPAITRPPVGKHSIALTIPVSTIYDLLREAVEDGVAYGYARAFKHRDTPTEREIVLSCTEAVMNSVLERFSIPE